MSKPTASVQKIATNNQRIIKVSILKIVMRLLLKYESHTLTNTHTHIAVVYAV